MANEICGRAGVRLFYVLAAASAIGGCATAPATQFTWERIAGPASGVELERDTAICEGAAINAAARVPFPSSAPTRADTEFTVTSSSGERYQGTALTVGGAGGFAQGLAAGTQARLARDSRAATMKACMAERGWLQRVKPVAAE